ncbi:hypothetical protein GCM10018785_22390 [Streptomyces longispororuber]|uniref:Uncharacterized protein n=1 Tax=Streptomyces longispororuber TaxID=68230 RepID=A0A919DIX6_9ACTN|nr:hypothetical protein GCM10018785_22390 [Streptomyces longispororuber]
MAASTTGDSSPGAAEPWKTSTRTAAPPGGDGSDIVVRTGSGKGRADEAGPDRAPVRSAPATRAAAPARRADLCAPDVLRALDALCLVLPNLRTVGGV